MADTLGWAFYQKGIYSSAINMFEDAIKLAAKNKEPENATYHYHLGLAYEKSEQPALARQHLERVLKIQLSRSHGVRSVTIEAVAERSSGAAGAAEQMPAAPAAAPELPQVKDRSSALGAAGAAPPATPVAGV